MLSVMYDCTILYVLVGKNYDMLMVYGPITQHMYFAEFLDCAVQVQIQQPETNQH